MDIHVWIIDKLSHMSVQGRINHSGAPYQRKGGPFLIRVASIFSGGALFRPKSWRPFLVVVVTFKPIHWTFTRQNSVLKIWQLIGPLAAGGEGEGGGTTGTKDNPAMKRHI